MRKEKLGNTLFLKILRSALLCILVPLFFLMTLGWQYVITEQQNEKNRFYHRCRKILLNGEQGYEQKLNELQTGIQEGFARLHKRLRRFDMPVPEWQELTEESYAALKASFALLVQQRIRPLFNREKLRLEKMLPDTDGDILFLQYYSFELYALLIKADYEAYREKFADLLLQTEKKAQDEYNQIFPSAAEFHEYFQDKALFHLYLNFHVANREHYISRILSKKTKNIRVYKENNKLSPEFINSMKMLMEIYKLKIDFSESKKASFEKEIFMLDSSRRDFTSLLLQGSLTRIVMGPVLQGFFGVGQGSGVEDMYGMQLEKVIGVRSLDLQFMNRYLSIYALGIKPFAFLDNDIFIDEMPDKEKGSNDLSFFISLIRTDSLFEKMMRNYAAEFNRTSDCHYKLTGKISAEAPRLLIPEGFFLLREIPDNADSKSDKKFRLKDKEGKYYQAINFPDRKFNGFNHLFYIPEEKLFLSTQTDFFRGLQLLSLCFILVFVCMIFWLIPSISRPIRSFADLIVKTSKDFSIEHIADFQAKYSEMVILRQSFLRRATKLDQNFHILQGLTELQKFIAENPSEDDFLHRVRQLYRDLFQLDFIRVCHSGELIFADRIRKSGAKEGFLSDFRMTKAENSDLSIAFDGQVFFYYEKKRLIQEFAESLSVQREFEVAGSLQESLMPDFHSEENLQAFFVPARFLGGDFYDIIDYGNHKYYIIADVSGKGLAAALYGARVKSSFQAFLQSDLPLNEVFSRVNDYLQQGNQDGFFCTLFAVQKEKQSNILHYCSAGHNNMLFIRNGQSVLLSAKGIPLGLFNGFVYSLEEMELQEGDLLFLYTDGVTEAENSDLHIFGLERIKLLIENMWQEDLSRISQSIQTELSLFAGEHEQSDDITFLLKRFT